MSPPGPVAPAFPPSIPSLDYGARMRMAARFQDQNKPKSFGDTAMQLDADIYVGGALHRMLKWQAGVTISYPGVVPSAAAAPTAGAPAVLPLDVLAKFEPLPEFNIYMGRMIVVADRYTPSGPWGMDEFFYPGVFTGSATAAHPASALQKSSQTGRDLGFNVWGALLGGTVKYYLGSYQFHDPANSPLWSGRLQVSLLSPEPGFYQRTTYYGTKDLLSFGVGGQYQKNGSVTSMAGPPAMMGGMPTSIPVLKDHAYFTADVNFEKRLGDAGTLQIYGAYNNWFADNRVWKNFFHASVGWTFPQIVGIGKFRPDIRFQQGTLNATDSDPSRIIDVQLSYVMMDWFARVNIGYRNISTYNAASKTNDPGNMLWFGLLYADP